MMRYIQAPSLSLPKRLKPDLTSYKNKATQVSTVWNTLQMLKVGISQQVKKIYHFWKNMKQEQILEISDKKLRQTQL